MITVFFRYDDYSSLSNPVVDRGLIDIFGRHGISCTFAVVPAITSLYPWVQGDSSQDIPLEGEKLLELRRASEDGVVDVALHGWRHLSNAHTGHPTPSEFVGLSVDEQLEILLKGRNFLAAIIGKRPTLFVPPWNSYDQNTEKALELAGFLGISANRYSAQPDDSTRLMFAPITVEIRGLSRALDVAMADGVPDPVVGVMMHPYDFHESGDKRSIISLHDFERVVSGLKMRSDVRVVPISALLESGRMTARRYVANRPSKLEVAYPRFLEKVGSDPVYRTVADGRRNKLRRNVYFSVLMLAIGVLGMGIGWLGRSITSGWIEGLVGYVPLVAVLAIAALIYRAKLAGAIYFRPASCLALTVGATLFFIA